MSQINLDNAIKLKQIRTYQSVKFGPRGAEHTTFIAREARMSTAREFKDLDIYLLDSYVYLVNKELGIEKIIFTSNVSDANPLEELALESVDGSKQESAS